MSMIDVWLRSGALGVILIPFLLLYLIAAGIVWLTHLSPARPFFVSVAVLFGLFSAFLANDVQHRNAEVKAAIFREADGVRTILRLDEALGAAGSPVTVAAVGYVQSVLTKEWPAMRKRVSAVEDLGARCTLA